VTNDHLLLIVQFVLSNLYNILKRSPAVVFKVKDGGNRFTPKGRYVLATLLGVTCLPHFSASRVTALLGVTCLLHFSASRAYHTSRRRVLTRLLGVTCLPHFWVSHAYQTYGCHVLTRLLGVTCLPDFSASCAYHTSRRHT
jgi:hypothetical protein